ncbi:hypothetical protein ACS0TY_031017 [Phlomoides rotata]
MFSTFLKIERGFWRLSRFEDVLEDVFFKALKIRRFSRRTSSQVLNYPTANRFKIGHRIECLRKRIDEIGADRSKFHFTEKTQLISVENKFREQTHSFVTASDIIGRDDDKENIVQLLLSPNYEDHVSVIPIVGIGGLGKTTVVKLAYNNDRVKQSFDLGMWISVSEDFRVGKVVEKILKSATGESLGHLDMDQMQRRLGDVLNDKKYLLVLDDVWNADRIKWMDLKELLMNCQSGSKIVVTTRSKAVATITSTMSLYNLTGLCDDDCLSLFLRCAFREPGSWFPNLVAIGEEIVKKCGGVPLAVKTLGSLLYMNTDEQEWLRIRDNDIWEIDQKHTDILPILRLSYEQLPSHLRRCFAYCSMLPKGLEIPREKMRTDNLKMWGSSTLTSCCQDVVEAFDGEILACKIHNLIHDLAQSVAGGEFLNVKSDVKTVSDRVRHLYFQNEHLSRKEAPKLLLKLKNMRSFRCEFKVKPLDKAFVESITRNFRCLRVLILCALDLHELPNSISDLKQLRYLDLSHCSNLKSLPKSFYKLVNLQCLNLINCENFHDLPRNFRQMINLRTLYLTCQHMSLPNKCHQYFSSLQFLLLYNCDFVQLPSQGLNHFTSLRVLRIYDCPRLASLPNGIKHLASLEKLWIWNCDDLDLSEGDALQGLTGLQSLLLMGLPKLINLPVGLRQNVARSLKFFRIANCANFSALPDWLPSFTLLQRLYIEDCPNLVVIPEGVLNHVAQVHISGCPNLA